MYLSHRLPVIEPPVDRLVMRYFGHGTVLCCRTAIGVGPYEDRAACTVPNAIGSIAAPRLPQYTVTFFLKYLRGSQSKLHKSHAQVQIQPFLGGQSGAESSRSGIFGNLAIGELQR